MTSFTWLALALVACGSGISSDPAADTNLGTFEAEVPPFIDALCTIEATCFAKNETECRSDVMEDMAYVKQISDDLAEGRCAACLHAKTVEYQKVLDASCDTAAADTQAVLDACDLSPSDGIDRDDEACAGYP